jgi:hypothetical protein
MQWFNEVFFIALKTWTIDEIEVIANANCLRILPKLSEWSYEYSAERRLEGLGGKCIRDDSESVDDV